MRPRAQPGMDLEEDRVSAESGFQIGADAPRHYQANVEVFMQPFVTALVERTVQPGDAVLDVACGTGFAARAAARVVGGGGLVVGSDVNPAMVTWACGVPRGDGAPIGWITGSAVALPVAGGVFDAAICQQGLQFFPDPSASLGEMARVIRPRGWLGVTVWAPVERSPYLDAQTAMLVERCGAKPPPFATTEQGLRGWLTGADLGQPEVELVEAVVDLPPLDPYAIEHLKALPWSGGFFALPETSQAEALSSMSERLADFATVDGLSVPFASYVATLAV